MMTVKIESAKLTVVFPQGKLPRIDPLKPEFQINLGGTTIWVSINAKAARKLQTWTGGAVLQGRLLCGSAGLKLLEAGFTYLDPKPVTTPVQETASVT